MHYVFDLWANRWRRREVQGDMIIVKYADDFVVGFEYESDARRFWEALRARLEEFALSSGQDPPDRVWPPCGGQARKGGAWEAGDLQVPRLCLHLRQVASRSVRRTTKDPARSHAGETQRGQGGAAQAHASADTRTGTLAGASRQGLLCLLRGSHEPREYQRFPSLCDTARAPHASAAEPERSFRVGTDAAPGRLPPLAESAFCRQTLEVRTGCPNWARPGLCGGR